MQRTEISTLKWSGGIWERANAWREGGGLRHWLVKNDACGRCRAPKAADDDQVASCVDDAASDLVLRQR